MDGLMVFDRNRHAHAHEWMDWIRHSLSSLMGVLHPDIHSDLVFGWDLILLMGFLRW